MTGLIMRIYLLLGHPDKASFNGGLADAYEAQAKAAGHEVRRQYLGDMQFDPILWHGYQSTQELGPDLVAAQQNITWCEHWVIFYPIWWGSVPALLKGFFDRALYSGFAYRYHDDDPMWDGLLTGRSAQVITTSDAPRIWTFMAYRNSDLGTVKYATLRFCGVKPVSVTRLDRMRDATPEERQRYIDRVRRSVPRSSVAR
jgi:NAD(P)H dehydrogenase (quinone)